MTGRFPPVALPDSPLAAALAEHCLAFPDAWVDYPWGDIVYKVGGKLFAITGPNLPVWVTVKATPMDAEVLTQLPHIDAAPYIGRHGWVTVMIEDEASLDHALFLVAESYALVRAATSSRRRAAR